MNIKEYSDWTDMVWISGDLSTKEQAAIVALGLVGEAGEVTEIIKKALRNRSLLPLALTDSPKRAALKEELGDVLYYWTRMCRLFAIDPEEVLELNMAKLNERYGK